MHYNLLISEIIHLQDQFYRAVQSNIRIWVANDFRSLTGWGIEMFLNGPTFGKLFRWIGTLPQS